MVHVVLTAVACGFSNLVSSCAWFRQTEHGHATLRNSVPLGQHAASVQSAAGQNIVFVALAENKRLHARVPATAVAKWTPASEADAW